MNPHAQHPTSVVEPFDRLLRNRGRVWQMARRKVIGRRYRGSVMGVAWCLAATAVYVRDIGQTIGIATTVMLCLAPVFYPVSAPPERYQVWLQLSPLTFVIEEGRKVLLCAQLPG
jgi:ABC-type polysaccharide/polyol phosphate export permease